MKLFQRKESAKRNLEDMLTPQVEETLEKCEIQEDKEVNTVGNGENSPKEKCAKEASFNALSCFGWKEEKTDRWLIKCANAWFLLISFIWFLLGAFTFAPVIFISNKVNVVFKNEKKSFICSIGIYIVLVVIFVLFI